MSQVHLYVSYITYFIPLIAIGLSLSLKVWGPDNKAQYVAYYNDQEAMQRPQGECSTSLACPARPLRPILQYITDIQDCTKQ